MEQRFDGGCLCGAVRFHFEGASLWCAHCHCTLCQRAHGAPVVTWVGVPREHFHLDAGAHLRWYDSTPGASRGFCDACGSTLFFQSTRWPDEMHIVRSNFDGAIDREPSGHAYWETHVAWLAFGDALPRSASPEAGN